MIRRPPRSTLLSLHDALPISLADPLTAGQIVHDHLVVTSFDGTATHDIDVTITGSNDNATITTSVSEDNAVTEAGGVEIASAHVSTPATDHTHIPASG